MYECHVTIDPVAEGPAHAEVERLAGRYAFKLAQLFKLTEGIREPSDLDSFMTGHGEKFSGLHFRMIALVQELISCGFTVRRYKIESIIIDSKYQDDPEGLLKGGSNVHY